MAVMAWNRLNPGERVTLMTLAAMHAEFGHDGVQFETEAVDHCASRACVAELGFLVQYGLAEMVRDEAGKFGYRLTGEGFAALPQSEEKAALVDHREEAGQALREEQ